MTPSGKGRVEVRTNTRVRQKYFVDESSVMSSIRKPPFKGWPQYSKVIRSSNVAISDKVVVPRCNKSALPGDIRVEVLRDGAMIKAIRIACPCGRHTELDCAYGSIPEQAAKG